MRADRLVATLLFLQSRGTVTAAEVADELEVSTRTARRDLEALSIAGIPVYSRAGRGGGWSLVGGARTDLSGLTADEARTLFLVAGPSSAVTPQVKAALRKLIQALPETFRAEAEQAAAAIVLDPAGWGATAPVPPRHLQALQQAVVEGRQIRLGYRDRAGDVTDRRVHPLGLVAKETTWYLIAGTDAGMRTFRVGRIHSMELTDDPVVRPDGFDLGAEWNRVVADIDVLRGSQVVQMIVEAWAVGWLFGQFGADRLTVHGPLDDGRVAVDVTFPASHHVAGQLAGYGAIVDVIAPPELRDELAVIGNQLVERYARPRRRARAVSPSRGR